MDRMLDYDERLTPAGEQLALRLYEPATGTIIKWLIEGVAGEQARNGDIPESVQRRAMQDRDLRDDIASDVVVSCLRPFMKMLDRGEFDEDGPATVLTYFIGACRNQLASVIDRRHAEASCEYARSDLLRWADGVTYADGSSDGRFEDLLKRAPHDLAVSLMLVVRDGISHDSAARKNGCNPATIRSQLYRYRQQLAAEHFAGKIEIPEATALGDWVRTTQPRDAA